MPRHPVRALLLALMLAATPACASASHANPVAVAQTADQKAYALLASYAAVLEEATDLVRDPALPADARRALIRAERIATPAAQALRIAFVTYLRARADYEAAATLPERERTAAHIAIAALRLSEAIGAAQAPLAAFAELAR